MREVSAEESVAWDGLGIVPTNFAIHGPKTVRRVDYEGIFVLDDGAALLGEYALRDDCPLEFVDLLRSIPLNGMRHLVPFYRGEFVFTPFRVDPLWLVVLTRGTLRIDERGSIGTLLAAMRVHLPSSLSSTLATREEALQEREQEMDMRESTVTRREQRVALLEAELQVAETKLGNLETNVRDREARLNALRDYALQMQSAFRRSDAKPKIAPQQDENPADPQGSAFPPP